MPFTPSPDCQAIAFYGWDASEQSLRAFWERLLAWFDAHACPPDLLSVHGEGFSGKVASFSRVHARLKARGFESVESISVFSMLPEGTIPVRDWKMTADLSRRQSCAVVAADSSLVTIENSMLAIARRAVEDLRPVYGVGYRRERRLGPALYAFGLNYGIHASSGPEYEESLRVSRWGDTGMARQVFRHGVLRDVYPYNFLTEAQLSALVDGIRLEAWIRQAAGRGNLASFHGNVSLWTVDDAALPGLRDVLGAAGLVFDARTP